MIAARSFAAELEREKTSQRTHEHLLTKARRGFVVGGSVYGYDNFEVKEGERRIRVEYRVNEAEAKIVREIFRRYADGEGLRALAQDLQKRGVPAPKAGRRGIGVWSYSSIREMLRRDRYQSSVELVIVPPTDAAGWAGAFKKTESALSGVYGKPTQRSYVVPDDCKAEDAFLACVADGNVTRAVRCGLWMRTIRRP